MLVQPQKFNENVCQWQDARCGQPASVACHTADAFGNVRSTGGDKVSFAHRSNASEKSTQVQPFIKSKGSLCTIEPPLTF